MSHIATLKGIKSPRSSSDDWFTPLARWLEWDREFAFTMDPCGHPKSPVSRRTAWYCSLDGVDGLEASWSQSRVYCNPPYSNLKRWVEKAHREMIAGCPLVVMLIPATKSEQPWWQNYVEPFRDGRGRHDAFTMETRYLRQRLVHGTPEDPEGAGTTGTITGTFPSALLIWRHR